MTAFSDTYKRLVGPKLSQIARVEGYFLALGAQTYTEAHATVMLHAMRLGAAYLHDDQFYALDDWIGSQILIAADSAEPAIAAAQAVADRTATDIARWEASCRTMIQ